MRKSYFVVLGITILISSSLAFTYVDEPLYKNLKVLPKNIKKPEMDTIMRGFTRALGVKCDYCHAKGQEPNKLDFASDANELKAEAREMMRMQARINKKFFDVKKNDKLKVTCYTCHHASGIPAITPPPQQGRPGGQQPQQGPTQQPPPITRQQ